MLIAYEDLGFTIKDIPTDDTRVPPYPTESLSRAQELMAWAKTQSPTVRWVIEGKGPYRVHGEIQ